jgi:hypothetical protein
VIEIRELREADWQLWGCAGVPKRGLLAESRAGPLPADTEAGLAGFTELAATAISNAHAMRVLATWSRAGAAFAVGAEARLGWRNVPTLVFETGGQCGSTTTQAHRGAGRAGGWRHSLERRATDR